VGVGTVTEVVAAPPRVGDKAPTGREAAVVGAVEGPSPARTRMTRQAAVLKHGCLDTGSQTVIVSSLACRVVLSASRSQLP